MEDVSGRVDISFGNCKIITDGHIVRTGNWNDRTTQYTLEDATYVVLVRGKPGNEKKVVCNLGGADMADTPKLCNA